MLKDLKYRAAERLHGNEAGAVVELNRMVAAFEAERVGPVATGAFEDLGDISAVPPDRSVRMSCEKCCVTWKGCADVYECPRCGAPQKWWQDEPVDPPAPASAFDTVLAQATEALKVVGTGKLRDAPMVSEGPRSYSPAPASLGLPGPKIVRGSQAAMWLCHCGVENDYHRAKCRACSTDKPTASAEMIASAWSVPNCLTRLADAADHLLMDHDCDEHGYEEVMAARDAARFHAAKLTNPTASAEPPRFCRSVHLGNECARPHGHRGYHLSDDGLVDWETASTETGPKLSERMRTLWIAVKSGWVAEVAALEARLQEAERVMLAYVARSDEAERKLAEATRPPVDAEAVRRQLLETLQDELGPHISSRRCDAIMGHPLLGKMLKGER